MLLRGSKEKGSQAILLTGATGFIGMEILARYLERTDRPVYTLVRAREEAEASARLREVLETLFGDPDAHADRVTAIRADLEAPGLGLSEERLAWLAERVDHVVHGAATVSFTLPLAQARAINVEGTRRMLDFAERCRERGGLKRFAYLSTAYVAGTHKGHFGEDDLDVGQRFRNSYERSKFEAEQLVRARADGLPIQILRPSIVVGERTTGWTSSFNVLYAPLKAFARGALPAIPARRSAPVDVVPVDYVADAVFELANQPIESCETYHLVAGSQRTTVGRLVDLSARHMGRRRPLTVPPILYRRIVQPLLLWRARGARRGALERSAAYFPYFSARVVYRDDRARARLASTRVRSEPVERYYHRLVEFALATRFGKRSVSRARTRERLPATR